MTTPDQIAETQTIEVSRVQRANHNAIQLGNTARHEAQLALAVIAADIERLKRCKTH